MSVVVPNEGELAILLAFYGYMSPHFGLFKNDITPNDSTVLSDLVEANFDGYSDTDGSWIQIDHGTDISGRGFAKSLEVTYTQSGIVVINTIYGWFIKTSTYGKIWKCGRFASPIVMDTTGKTIKLTDISLAQGTIT